MAPLAFGAAILTLLAVGTMSYRSVAVSAESDGSVRHTHLVLGQFRNLLIELASIQSNARGFALAGTDSFLADYGSHVSGARQVVKEIGAMTADNALQQQRMPGLRALVDQKVAWADHVIELRRTQGLQATIDEVRLGQGERLDAQTRTLVSGMRDEEQRLMRIRIAAADQRQVQTKNILLLGTILGLIIVMVAGWSALREGRRRRLVEDALREGEARFRSMADNMSQLAWMTDKSGSITWYNQRWYDYTGTDLEQMAGWGWQKVYHPDHAQRVLDKIAKHFQSGDIWEDTFPLRGKDGSYRSFLSRAVPLRDANGNVLQWFGTNTDISETEESGVKYRGLLEAAPDAMVVVNQGGEIVLLNVQAEKKFGYSRDELLGQRVKNIIPEGFAERLAADGTRSAAEALAQQIGTGIELSGRRKDGSAFPIEIMLSPLDSAEGILVTAAIRDISVRRAAEQHLAQMEGRYRGLLEAAPDAMVVVNQDGEIVLLNVQAEKKFGYRRDELLGQKVKNIIPEGFAERLVADALRSDEDALAQQIGTGIELAGRRRDGSEFPIEIMLSPLESAEGLLVTAAIRDISVRRAAEETLMGKVAELNRSNEELGQFAYIASHDLQEPLRMVASYTQLLSKRYKGKLDTDADEFIAFAVDGASRMQRLIQDLLTYSRVGTRAGELGDVSSEKALQQAITNLRGAVQDSGAQITHDPLPVVRADETQLVQLFQNLVGNGIKYKNTAVPHVHICAARNSEKKWIFSVKDNGLGIDAQYFERIFGMFQRLHKREEFAGTGIGLAICKKIVERHGGQIAVESQLGQGSTFRFALSGSEVNA